MIESWVTSLVLTRHPFPAAAPKTSIGSLHQNILKHFKMYENNNFNKNFFSKGGLIGIASSWDKSLTGACKRSCETLSRISFEDKQYRTDLFNQVSGKWNKVSKLLMS
jgi:hypothetical protein